jgi:hypothetical protein
MTDAQTTILSVFAAAILTAAGARWVATFQSSRDARQRELDRQLQRDESRLADERSLRDTKRERLRRDYEDLVFAATEIRGATAQLAILESGDTEEARNARVSLRLEEATRDLGRAIVRLRLEGIEELVDAYREIQGLWFEYADYVAKGFKGHDNIAGTLTELEAAVDSILERTKADLEALSHPL